MSWKCALFRMILIVLLIMTKFQAKCFDSTTLLELTASTLVERQLTMEMPAFKSLVQWYSTL